MGKMDLVPGRENLLRLEADRRACTAASAPSSAAPSMPIWRCWSSPSLPRSSSAGATAQIAAAPPPGNPLRRKGEQAFLSPPLRRRATRCAARTRAALPARPHACRQPRAHRRRHAAAQPRNARGLDRRSAGHQARRATCRIVTAAADRGERHRRLPGGAAMSSVRRPRNERPPRHRAVRMRSCTGASNGPGGTGGLMARASPASTTRSSAGATSSPPSSSCSSPASRPSSCACSCRGRRTG